MKRHIVLWWKLLVIRWTDADRKWHQRCRSFVGFSPTERAWHEFYQALPDTHLWGPTPAQVWRARFRACWLGAMRTICWVRGKHVWKWGSHRCQRCGGSP